MVRTDECSAADRARRAGVVSKDGREDGVVKKVLSQVLFQDSLL
jgi:hypothetical protein